jgi:ribonuclease D
MHLVSKTQILADFCGRAAGADFVALDTEFMRETTFWPRLCLIQMAAGDEEIIVDTLAEGLDLAPFYELMANAHALKVFHAARQDIEIIHHQAGIIPHPVFDTQVAAMVCGFGEAVSYGMLVSKLLKREIDKTSRFTDWSRRPLSDKQLQYALADVSHLRMLYPKLREQLDRSERASWLDEEMAVLTDPATYEAHPEEAWRRLKMRVKSNKALAIMMELAAWRETEAQSQDVPRNRILKDDAIYDLANQAPRSLDELSGLRSIHGGFAKSVRGPAVLQAIERGLARDTAELPRIKRGSPAPADALAIIDLLRVLLKNAAARHGVAQKLIATTDDLEKIARSENPDVAALNGWRRKLFGEDALAVKRGEIALGVRNGQIRLLKADGISTADKPDNQAQDEADENRRRDRKIESQAVSPDDDAAWKPAKS